MNWMVENWYLIVAAAAVLALAGFGCYKFAGLPTEDQVARIMEWLVWACIEAECNLQSGTGQLKLRQVYDMFCNVPAFSAVAKMVSFEVFSDWVSEALAVAKEMLVKNQSLARYVYGDDAEREVEKLRKQVADFQDLKEG